MKSDLVSFCIGRDHQVLVFIWQASEASETWKFYVMRLHTLVFTEPTNSPGLVQAQCYLMREVSVCHF